MTRTPFASAVIPGMRFEGPIHRKNKDNSMARSMFLSTLGALLRLLEWPFTYFADRSRKAAQTAHLEVKSEDLDDYRIQMGQTKNLVAFRRDTLLPLLTCLRNGQNPCAETDERLLAFVPQAVELRQNTTHGALARIPLMMQECETLDYRSEAGIKRLDEYRQAIDDAERTTSARRQALKKQYPANPLLMGTEEPAV